MLYKAGPNDKLNWLKQHGDRTLSDVQEDEFGEYVVMGAGRGKVRKVYLTCVQTVDKSPKKVDRLGITGGEKSNNFFTIHSKR